MRLSGSQKPFSKGISQFNEHDTSFENAAH